MDTLTRPFDKDELDNIEHMVNHGIARDRAIRNIYALREADEMSHCTVEAEKRMKAKAASKKAVQPA